MKYIQVSPRVLRALENRRTELEACRDRTEAELVKIDMMIARSAYAEVEAERVEYLAELYAEDLPIFRLLKKK